MATFDRFEDIEAWRKARLLTRRVYQVSNTGDFKRDFELRGQIRWSTVSVMSNIAEGFERNGNREFLQYISWAKGSCGEVRAQLYVARDVGYMSEDESNPMIGESQEVSRLLAGLMKYLQRTEIKGSKYKVSGALLREP